MSSKQSTVDFILDQIADTNMVRAKKMFGEYAIYYHEKVVALVCDDQLFVKPTPSGKAFINNYVEGIPYPGAKSYLLISGDLLEDSEWLTHLVRLTASELPEPKKKRAKK
ncbi:TfoX/Sxy family protein [Fluoribacter dumoffii]|uniref:TfoX/Sxy family protein n=1 Tax=Fluoribacter dumoffii TaxID=463 RepID=UPI002243C77F|nr:TfoX/Sxy family protein [Fluoribacter dumoffii]MCW8418878.1 TfoX/Sxy family protein [Fluoribacter dumoffii]MCW8453278.1 TfoX/Sxy family protein [Fluoribacter dumoffii]MCW8459501.1 TfoX/Sxy family protein [Fluoribacter dumoffii]MCW8482861.1 TfoX/Sxy family protein [Fluoribacter dumoffii]